MTASRTAPFRRAHLGKLVTAHHEAAHAVIALHLDGWVSRVRIWPVTATTWAGVATMQFLDCPDGEHAAAIALLAGAHAERHWLALHDVPRSLAPHDTDASAGPDIASAHESLAAIPRRDRPTFRSVDREAARLVIHQWDRIEHLAARLLTAHDIHQPSV